MGAVEDAIQVIVGRGYKTTEEVQAEFAELKNDYKAVQPNVSDDALNVQVLSVIGGRVADYKRQKEFLEQNTATFTGVFFGLGKSFDQNEEARKSALKNGIVNEDGKAIFTGATTKNKKLIGQPIPEPEESQSRVSQVVATVVSEETTEENWKPCTAWQKNIRTPPALFSTVKFKASGATDKTYPILNINDETSFEVVSAEKVNFPEMAKALMPENIINFQDLLTAEQPKDYKVLIFRAQVVKSRVTGEGKSNIVELKMIAETMEDILKADSSPNQTIWCDKAVPIDLTEGDIVWAVVNKWVGKKEGSTGINGLGFWVEKSFAPVNPPIAMNAENTKAIEAEINKPEDWAGETK